MLKTVAFQALHPSFICLALVGVMVTNRSDATDPPSRADLDLFEIHVRPLLVNHCISCHGDSKQEGGLRLTSLDAAKKGGESGPAIVPGQPSESLVIEAIKYETLEMPPDGKLDDAQIAAITNWIQAGAPWPSEVVLRAAPKITEKDRQWWCYQPISDPAPPEIGDRQSEVIGIDRFIRARLKTASIAPSSPADPLALVRKVHFAITGLPPDRQTIAEALSSDFDYESLVDRLLESKAYGENQARFWLDLVRYAESDGYRADHARPEAYRYRDYVIQSFNEDKPYDQFILEQLAGDEIDPGNREALTATMYLRHWIYEHNQRDVETQWHEILSDITETTADVFLAQGLKCARCHDHKFDPLLQRDYFRMKAFFAAFQPAEAHPVASPDARSAFQQQQHEWDQATADIRARLREIEYPVLLQHATREGFEKFIPEIKAMIRKHPAEREPYEQQIATLAERQFDLPYDKLAEWLSEEHEKERQSLRQRLAEFEHLKPDPLPTMKFVGSDIGPVAPPTVIPDDPDREPIAPGYFTLLDPSEAEIITLPESLQSTGRRTTLAKWIASAENPLTARVIVNRIWQQHFGRGLVETSSDFGKLGSPPSHPLLLDWLASRFIEERWSLKKLHRLILTSATYRQTSQRKMDDQLKSTDPANRLLWRMNSRRLSGEEITDAILTASSELKSDNRAIRKKVLRNSPDPLLAAFDAPERIRSNGRRHRTTSSTQALLMANGDWTHQRATMINKRLIDEGHQDDDTFVAHAYLLLFGREPNEDEIDLGLNFVRQYADQTPKETAPPLDLLVDMPGTESKAVNLKPNGPVAMSLRASESLPDADFTVEAVVMLRSLYEDANVRTIVAHWNGSKSRQGWSLGVTSTKSAFKPRNLILQLVGRTSESDKLHYEVIASNLRPELNKPYYVAVRVHLADPSSNGITFYLKDLSDKQAKLQSASVPHSVVKGIRPENDLTIGGRFGTHQWDGLIDNIRIESIARDLSQQAIADSPEGLPGYVVDWRFEDEQKLGRDSSGSGNHAWARIDRPEVKTPKERARVALIHALLNSNELIYVD